MRPNWFVALPVPSGQWFEKAIADAPACLRLFHPDDLHLTLAFLGSYRPERESAVTEQMRKIFHAPVSISLSHAIALPKPSFFSAISLELEKGRGAVAGIIGNNRTGLYKAAGAQADNRPPLPHLTIGRPHRTASDKDRQEILAWAKQLQPQEELLLFVDRVALYTWADNRKERQFKIIEEFVWPSGNESADH